MVVIVCLIQIGQAYYLSLRHRAQQKELEKLSETAELITPEEFKAFCENIKKLYLYDTKMDAAYVDTFLTLSTCAYHVDGGRLVVVAKRMD